MIVTDAARRPAVGRDRLGRQRAARRRRPRLHVCAAHRRRPDRARRPRGSVPVRLADRQLGRDPAQHDRAADGHPRIRCSLRPSGSGSIRPGAACSASAATGSRRSAIDPGSGIGGAGGYVGNGVAVTNLAGRTLRDLVLGHDTELTAPAAGQPPRPRLGARAAAVHRHAAGLRPVPRRRPPRDVERASRTIRPWRAPQTCSPAASPPAARGAGPDLYRQVISI